MSRQFQCFFCRVSSRLRVREFFDIFCFHRICPQARVSPRCGEIGTFSFSVSSWLDGLLSRGKWCRHPSSAADRWLAARNSVEWLAGESLSLGKNICILSCTQGRHSARRSDTTRPPPKAAGWCHCLYDGVRFRISSWRWRTYNALPKCGATNEQEPAPKFISWSKVLQKQAQFLVVAKKSNISCSQF